MKRLLFDMYSMQALQELHRYRAVMFSPTYLLYCTANRASFFP